MADRPPGPPGPDRVRVLWLIKGLGPGGAEQLLVAHARAGDHERFAYEAAYLVPWKDQLVPALAEAGVGATCWASPRPWDLRWAWRLRRRLATQDPPVDVVHGHSPLVGALTRLVARTVPRARRPALVYTEHNEWGRHRPGTRWANRVTLRLEDHVLAVSDGVLSTMTTRAPVEVLHHGIDVEAVAAERAARDEVRAELGIGADELVVGIVANLRREKAYEVWLDAARRVLDELAARPAGTAPAVRFVSVGQGPLEAELRARHAELGLGDRVLLLGYRPDATRVLGAFDVFSLASRHEGLPVALMEACAQGLPLVLTRVGGIPEVVVDGEAGLLVDPDDPAALTAALVAVIDDEALRSRLAAGSAVLADRFGAAPAVARLEELYAALARRRR